MKFNIGEIVKIVQPKELTSKEVTPFAKNYLKIGLLGTVTDYHNDTNCYEVAFRNGIRDWYFGTWLKKSEEEVSSMPKQNMDWSKIKEMTEMALANKKDIIITINADGSKEIEISTPTTSIVETNMRTKYVLEDEKNDN